MGKCVATGLIGSAALVIWGGVFAAAQADCAPGAVELRWPAGQGSPGQARFSIEVADTPDLRAKGLMDRPHLPASAGMLFVYPEPEHAFYWMKNTLIPLDILFADASGTITVIRPDAVPGDLTPLDGGEGVQYVLEINGGLAARMGIVPGSVMRAAVMDQEKLGWSCRD